MEDRAYQIKCEGNILAARERGVRKQLVSMATGLGKCFGEGTPILMHDGSVKEVQHVVVGDVVMGHDSLPRRVTSLTRGTDEMFRVNPIKGSAHTVNRAHTLSLQMSPKLSKYGYKTVDITVEEYLTKSRTFKHRAKLYRKGVEFASSPYNLDPYFVGAWIGDGTHNQPSITNVDEEVISWLYGFAKDNGVGVSVNGGDTYRVLCNEKGRKSEHWVLKELRALGLYCNKYFIPNVYKVNSREVRLKILAGLIDTDGCLICDKTGYEIVTISPRLADDIVFLARSLGLSAYKKKTVKKCQTGAEGEYYRVIVYGQTDEIPVLIKRKKANIRQQKKDHLCTGFSVESQGYGNYYGFSLEGDPHFLLGDFTVTHNSRIFSNLPRHALPNRPRSMMIVHTIDLVAQGAEHLVSRNPTLDVGIEMADEYASNEHQIVVGSVQTLGREDSNRLYTFDPNDFSWLLIDEAHRSLAPSYRRVIDHICSEGATLVGFTATPKGAGGQGMGQIYDEIVYHYGIKEGVADGWLVPPRGIKVRTTTALDRVSTVGDDFNQGELASVVNTQVRNEHIVREWLKEASDRLTVGFTVDIQHAKDLAQEFRNAGVAAEAIWGEDADRDEKLQRLRDGITRVILNAQLLTEGFDLPALSCCIMARPTRSQTFFIQAIGRTLRLFEGKTDSLVMDVTDSCDRYSLVTLPSIWGLPPKLNLRGKSVVEAEKEIEEAEAFRPNINFSNLEDLSQIQTYIEQVDLFEVKYTPEVEQASEYQWHQTVSGDYLLLLPGGERVTISKNFLGHYDIKGRVKNMEFEDREKDLGMAFATADNFVKMFGRTLLARLRRAAPVREEPITRHQKDSLMFWLRQRTKEIPDLSRMSKREADQLLRKLMAA